MDKPDIVNIYNRILFSLKKEENSDICYNMGKTWEYYAQWNKLQKYKYQMVFSQSSIYMRYLEGSESLTHNDGW